MSFHLLLPLVDVRAESITKPTGRNPLDIIPRTEFPYFRTKSPPYLEGVLSRRIMPDVLSYIKTL